MASAVARPDGQPPGPSNSLRKVIAASVYTGRRLPVGEGAVEREPAATTARTDQ